MYAYLSTRDKSKESEFGILYILPNMHKYDTLQVNHSVCLARSLIHEKNLVYLPCIAFKGFIQGVQ